MTHDRKKITAQCLGIVLICFALGLFLGGWLGHTGIFNNSANMVKIENQIAQDDIHYYLNDEQSSDYKIEFNDIPEHPVAKFYEVSGLFTNTSDRHFKSIELDFSLLDKDKNKIGDLKAYCDGLNAGQSWMFTATNQTNLEVNVAGVEVILDDVIIIM